MEETAAFHRDGFIVLEDLFAQAAVDVICDKALANFDELQELIRERQLSVGVGIKNGFKEVVQRHPHRFEMTYKMDSVEIGSLVFNNKRLMTLVHNILGDDCDCINRSLVLSLPNADDQAWHVDGGHLSLTEHLPCHCLNVFIPLVDVELQDGPTELRTGSHTLTRDLQKMYLAAFLSKRLGIVTAPCLARGGALLFDYRTLHRGRANTSQRRRPILVFTFAKRSFRDILNFPAASVFTAVPRVSDELETEVEAPSSSSSSSHSTSSRVPFIYRVTGPQSIERLTPQLVAAVSPRPAVDASTLHASDDRLDFCWETTCEVSWRTRHAASSVLNKLHNSAVLEDKANLAFLQLRMECNVLETYVAAGAREVRTWAESRWRSSSTNTNLDNEASTQDWWVVKASRGNGGRDVWVMTQSNYTSVESEFGEEELVLQKYVSGPMLWRGKKFHLRCYSLLLGDMSALVYQHAFILTAGREYGSGLDDDKHKHITNLSINKRFPSHPGQVPSHLPMEFPALWPQICEIWAQVAHAAADYMQQQASARHFEFFGIDIIADSAGQCWLIEINRLPGLESSANNKQGEDAMYDEMMRGVLGVVLWGETETSAGTGGGGGSVGASAGWDVVATAPIAPTPESSPSAETWRNLLKWKAFTRKHRAKLVLSASASAAAAASATPAASNVPFDGRSPSANSTAITCGVLGCTAIEKGATPLRCSRCKTQYYCSADHQKAHFGVHKSECRAPASATANAATSAPTPTSQPGVAGGGGGGGGEEVRISRCMFCGDEVTLRSEEEAVEHMRVCPALQEQLNGEGQFTIPKVLRDKGVTLPGQK